MSNDLNQPINRLRASAYPFRRAILRGLAVVCPPLLTVLIIIWAVNTTKSYFLQPVTGWARQGLVWSLRDVQEQPTPGYHQIREREFIPEDIYDTVQRQPGETPPITADAYYARYVDLTILRPQYAIPFFLAVFVLLLYFLGKFMAAGIGGLVGNAFERMVSRVPGVRAVYSSVKQVTDFLFTEREIKATRVVAVEFPRKGAWSVGFVTGENMGTIEDVAGEPVLAVLIPYSPVPVTGCTIIVRRSECIDLDMTFDQACQFIVSCGVVIPPALIANAREDRAGEKRGSRA